ncbi:competence protein CoiA [Halalkalibacter krulwichiae]|uniref:Competence protein CoiA-like family protein n=1 Tax=Halalkalibacter krulwichiae TaxID=199441 RepID=A0A1X9MDE3_9BACI|nr:competence protein CoiA family protein [Halalkalibacter krulwichiae]ARK31459.1 Competence protein CoiA-like family protein [Halalkalibacter krulwichiae]
MFNAKFEDGTIISMIDDWRIDELRELRNKRKFYCPVCNSLVQLKLGVKKLWHFAHKANVNCDESLERESMYHLKGKKRLYHWLQNQGIEVALECYLPIIRQRPDLLFRYNKILYAIEFQCSPINLTLFEKRTRGYQEIGIVPIWILGGNRVKRHGPKTFTIKSFEWLSCQKSTNQLHQLIYYCPERDCFARLNQITPYTSIKSLASYREIPLLKTPVDFIVKPDTQRSFNLFEQWLVIRKHWRYQFLTPYPVKAEKMIRNVLYKYNVPVSLFPLEAGWPTDYHYLISTPTHYWQLYLLFECLLQQSIHQPFSRNLVIQSLFPHIHNNIFPLRQMLEGRSWTLAIDGYLSFLVQIGFLMKDPESRGEYQRIRNIEISPSIEKAIEKDQSLKLKHHSKQSRLH